MKNSAFVLMMIIVANQGIGVPQGVRVSIPRKPSDLIPKKPEDLIPKDLPKSPEDFRRRVEQEVGNAEAAIEEFKKKVDHFAPRGIPEELWGEGGRHGYVLAAKIMLKRSSQGRVLSESFKRVLRYRYGDTVDRVQIHWDITPLDKWSAGNVGFDIEGVDTQGQTYGYNIYMRPKEHDWAYTDTLRLLAHEIQHVKQFEKYDCSLSNFGYHYFKNLKKADLVYKNNEMEIEAEDTANKAMVCYYGEALGFAKAAAFQQDGGFDIGAYQWVVDHNYTTNAIRQEIAVCLNMASAKVAAKSPSKIVLDHMHEAIKNCHMSIAGIDNECRIGQHVTWAAGKSYDIVGTEILQQIKFIRSLMKL